MKSNLEHYLLHRQFKVNLKKSQFRQRLLSPLPILNSMTPRRSEKAIFEFKNSPRRFLLHRSGKGPETANRNGTDRITVSVTLKTADEMWVLELPENEQPGRRVEARELHNWSVIDPAGVFKHPDDSGKVWKASPQTKRLISEVLPQGSAVLIGDYLAVDHEGAQALARLLTKLKSIPWTSKEQLGQRGVAHDGDSAVQSEVLGVNPRVAELTGELQALGEKADALKASVKGLSAEETSTNERLGPLRIENASLVTEESRLRGEVARLTSKSVRLEKKVNDYKSQLTFYRQYIQAKDATAVDRELRSEHWEAHEEADALREVKRAIAEGGRVIPWVDLLTLHLALHHAPFTILQGSPGAGKTSALQLYAQHIGMCCDTPIAVSPAWMNQEDVLGHYDMITQQFVEGDLGRILLAHQPRDHKDTRRVRLAVLDEINLVTVEHVFSGLMSALALDPAERKMVTLHRQSGEGLAPRSVAWPDGLLLAGTANNDHTVVAFSDRFRDRSVIHTLLPLKPEDVVRAGLREPEATSKTEPLKDLTCQTWAAWKKGADGPTGTADVPPQPDLTPLIQTFVEKVPAHHLSVRSLRRGVSMARHAQRLIHQLGGSLDGLQFPAEGNPEGSESKERFVVSLGLLPTLVQRAVHLARPGHEQAQLLEDLHAAVHPALEPHLASLKG